MKSLGSLLKSIFKTKTIDESAFEDIEDALIEGDVGASAAVAIVDELRSVAKKEKITDFDALKKLSTRSWTAVSRNTTSGLTMASICSCSWV